MQIRNASGINRPAFLHMQLSGPYFSLGKMYLVGGMVVDPEKVVRRVNRQGGDDMNL